ncbi:MAG: hypothetical protein ABSC36_03910 [Gaiellaceae bacterium]
MTSAEGEPRSESAPSEARGVCPGCGAVVEPSQEYCLACGERLVEAGSANLSERWRQALSLADRDWGWPILIALLIAILASVFAILALPGKKTSTLQALGPSVRLTSISATTEITRTTKSSGTTGGTSATAKTATSTGTTVTSPSSPIHSAGLIAWPGPSAYTVVLASIPISSGRAAARQKALEALHSGLGPDVGVLDSSDFSSLHPGYFVIFSGVYKSQSEAMKHLSAAQRAGFNSPYAKRVAS